MREHICETHGSVAQMIFTCPIQRFIFYQTVVTVGLCMSQI